MGAPSPGDVLRTGLVTAVRPRLGEILGDKKKSKKIGYFFSKSGGQICEGHFDFLRFCPSVWLAVGGHSFFPV
jgi:hypothetical protein